MSPPTITRLRMKWRLALLIALFLTSHAAAAAESSPGVLALSEVAPGTFVARWSPPRLASDVDAPIALRFPPHCEKLPGFRLKCGPLGLSGPVEVTTPSAEAFRVDFVVTFSNGVQKTMVLSANRPVQVLSPSRSAGPSVWLTIAAQFGREGFRQLQTVPTVALLLFGFALIVPLRRRLVTVTAILALVEIAVVYTVVGLRFYPPDRLVTFVSALSLLYIAFEAVRVRDTWMQHSASVPVVLVGGVCGLCLGSVARDLDLPPHHAPSAIAWFVLAFFAGQVLLALPAWGLEKLVPHSRTVAFWGHKGCVYGMGGWAAYLCFALVL